MYLFKNLNESHQKSVNYYYYYYYYYYYHF